MWLSRLLPRSFSPAWVGYALTGAALALLTAALAPSLGERHLAAVVPLYLLVCLLAAAGWGTRVGVPAVLAASLLLDLFFVPPLNRLAVDEPRDGVALLVFLAVAGAGASLVALLRRDVMHEAARQAEAAILLELSGRATRLRRSPTPWTASAPPSPEPLMPVVARSCGRTAIGP